MKRFTVILLFVIVLTSCVPSESAIQTAISRTQTAIPTATFILTPSLVVPSQTLIPSPTITKIPTLTPTLTLIPSSSFLLQEDFEDNKANGWVSYPTKGDFTITQELDGNHCLLLSGPKDWPQIWYRNSSWIDYAFESRIKFLEGRNVNIGVHLSDSGFYYLLTYSGSDEIFFAQLPNALGKWDGDIIGRGVSKKFIQDQWYKFRVEIKGNLVNAYVDNTSVLRLDLQSPLSHKRGGIGYIINGGEKLCFDDIKVWSLK